jgi:hypothetical protein
VLTFEDKKLTFFTEIKKEVRSHLLPQLLAMAHQHQPQPFILVAGTIAPAVKETLQQEGINWLEASGNIYVKQPGIFVWINTQKPHPVTVERGNRAFAKTGLKLVFLFLLDKTCLNLPYRQLAATAGIGIGNITNIMKGLKEEGFLLQQNKNEYTLQDKKGLLNRWMAAYNTKLKPGLRIGTFRFLKEDGFLNWQQLTLRKGKSYWGGEPAGELYAHYLKPAILTLYTEEGRSDLIKNYRLVPDPRGNVEAYKKFWSGKKKATAFPAPRVYSPGEYERPAVQGNGSKTIR